MPRLLILSIAAAIIMLGFGAPFFISGVWGYAVAVTLILAGSLSLWFLEKRTVNNLNKENALNKVLNTNDGPDG